jgi:membrane-anchored protein YejM (alkaline phosphatase superfamily)
MIKLLIENLLLKLLSFLNMLKLHIIDSIYKLMFTPSLYVSNAKLGKITNTLSNSRLKLNLLVLQRSTYKNIMHTKIATIINVLLLLNLENYRTISIHLKMIIWKLTLTRRTTSSILSPSKRNQKLSMLIWVL